MSQERRGCLAVLFGRGATQPKPGAVLTPRAVDVQLRDNFLSATELQFFKAAELATRERFTLLTKINLGDLFRSPTGDAGVRNQINQKHVDFLLCDPDTLKPRLGIELDDSSHARASATKGDQVKDDAFESAGLPLIRFPAGLSYSSAEISSQIEKALGAVTLPHPHDASSAIGTPGVESPSGVPQCPNCGVDMVLRPGVKGRYDAFYGCANYPRCREVMPIKTV